MGTLGRYMAKRFIVSILGVFTVCLALIFFIDFLELLREASKREGVSMGSLVVIALLRLPKFAELTLPFAVLIGSIAAFMALSRTSELTVVRAAGISAWQFLRPALFVAFVLGALSTAVYNPMAAWAKASADRLIGDVLGKENESLLRENKPAWLRQNGADGPSIIYAGSVADQGRTLSAITVLQFDRNRKFLERIEADKARLSPGYWALENARVTNETRGTETYEQYFVSTHLERRHVMNSITSARGVSFWELPRFIEFAEKAGLESERYKLEYQLLLTRPILLAVMVLIAATCSLRAFRFGGIQTMVVAGLSAGFAFFVFSELSRKVGVSGLVSPSVAAWAPVIVACLLAATVLLHQEDG
ncbi:MAG: LPS export ABC transporter permease LptG [Dichotomicrobium sp.]